MTSWKNRTVGHEDVDPSILVPNPQNWRIHPASQKKALADVLGQVGYVDDVIVCRDSNLILDGHLRVELATERGEKTIPVKYVDLDEKEQALVLATFDPLSVMAEADYQVQQELLSSIMSEHQKILKQIGIKKDVEIPLSVPPDDPAEDLFLDSMLFENRGIKQDENLFWNEAILPSNNKFGIPALREDMLSDMIPTNTWCAEKGATEEPGTIFVFRDLGNKRMPKSTEGQILSFYCEDKRFEKVWGNPVDYALLIKRGRWGAVMSPDFSMWRVSPLILNLWNLYRSFWCARYWQEHGIKIMPSLNWTDERSYEYAFSGIPVGAPVVACQCRTAGEKRGKYYFLKGLQEAIDQIKPKNIVIYGGEIHRDWIGPNVKLQECRVHYVEAWSQARNKRRTK